MESRPAERPAITNRQETRTVDPNRKGALKERSTTLHSTMLPNADDLFFETVNAAVAIEEPADAANALLQITTALFEVGNIDYALALLQKTFRRIRELGDPKERAYLLRLFVTLQCRQGLIDAAAETLPLIDESEQRAVAWKELAKGQAESGRLNDALRIVEEEIEDFDDYEEVLVAVGEEQARQGRLAEAEMTAAKIESEELRVRLLRKIAGGKNDVTETSIPIESARAIDDLFHRSSALRRIGISLHQNGKPSEARAVFKEALNTVQQIGNTYSRTNVLTDFAVDLGDLGIDDSAIKVFHLATGAAQEIDDISFALPCLCKIAECQTAARLFDEAFDTVKIIKEWRDEIPRKSPERGPFDRDVAAALGKLAIALKDSVEFEEESDSLFQKALDTARCIADAHCRAVALMRLAVTVGAVSEPVVDMRTAT